MLGAAHAVSSVHITLGFLGNLHVLFAHFRATRHGVNKTVLSANV